MTAFDNPTIRDHLLMAWNESEPGTANAHEEGGFVLQSDDGSLIIERWARGAQNKITVPNHDGGMRNGMKIIATFHTHPNPGENYLQEPSPTDIRAVRDDPDLAHADYQGEIVISTELTYVIAKSGTITVAGRTSDLFAQS